MFLKIIIVKQKLTCIFYFFISEFDARVKEYEQVIQRIVNPSQHESNKAVQNHSTKDILASSCINGTSEADSEVRIPLSPIEGSELRILVSQIQPLISLLVSLFFS